MIDFIVPVLVAGVVIAAGFPSREGWSREGGFCASGFFEVSTVILRFLVVSSSACGSCQLAV